MKKLEVGMRVSVRQDKLDNTASRNNDVILYGVSLSSLIAEVRRLKAHVDDMHQLIETLLPVYAEKYGKNSYVEIEARATMARVALSEGGE